MKVLIGTFTLAQHDVTTTRDGLNATTVRTTAVSNFRIQSARVAQVAEFVRAAQVQTFDRGNRKTTITFNVSREHTTIRNCEAFLLAHIGQVPNKGLITLQAKETSGAVTERYLKDALCEVVDASYDGVTSFHSYQLIGGDILTEKPKST